MFLEWAEPERARSGRAPCLAMPLLPGVSRLCASRVSRASRASTASRASGARRASTGSRVSKASRASGASVASGARRVSRGSRGSRASRASRASRGLQRQLQAGVDLAGVQLARHISGFL